MYERLEAERVQGWYSTACGCGLPVQRARVWFERAHMELPSFGNVVLAAAVYYWGGLDRLRPYWADPLFSRRLDA